MTEARVREARQAPQPHGATSLSAADNRIRQSEGLPPQEGENELGFKMVKWISTIEFVHSFDHLGAGQGGYNKDHEFYGYRMPV